MWRSAAILAFALACALGVWLSFRSMERDTAGAWHLNFLTGQPVRVDHRWGVVVMSVFDAGAGITGVTTQADAAWWWTMGGVVAAQALGWAGLISWVRYREGAEG